jgi:hypothetical protein
MPPPNLIENPDPQPGTNNFYTFASPNISTPPPSFGVNGGDPGNTSTGGLVNCSDPAQPGVAAIQNYLKSLPYRPFNNGNCAPGHFYQVDNQYPYYDHLGGVIQQNKEFPAGPAFAIGPQTIPTIGDSLSASNISWKYYGEGFSQAADPAPANELYCAICNAFQYSRSIMTGPLKSNLQDLNSFFADVSGGTLPSVSFVKPDILLDSHPGTSTPPLFEAFTKRIIQAVQQNPSLWQDTAILITFDESGGYYDSGYIQPIDFFGDGPRTALIAVSPFAKTGFVDHTYADHASILKFIERNWGLAPLSDRSRDNLPNPIVDPWRPYLPVNSPAIGDLMEMFQFPVTKRFASHDFNGDGKSDIAWRNTNGDAAIWLMTVTSGNAQVLSSADYGIIDNSWQIVGQRDFNGDGKADLLWSNTNGDTQVWLMNGTTVSSTPDLGPIGNGWSVVGTGDFNGDGFGDILWRNTNGDTSIWLMTGNATQVQVLAAIDLGLVPTGWSVAQTGDFNGDGKADILWYNANGDTSIWLMTGTATQVQVLSTTDLGIVPPGWTIAGTGDFNGDGMSDILWRNSNGDTSMWLMTGNGPQVQVSSTSDLGLVPTSWSVALTGDFSADGMSDILWRNTNGDTSIWFMNGSSVSATSGVGVVPGSWIVQAAGAE